MTWTAPKILTGAALAAAVLAAARGRLVAAAVLGGVAWWASRAIAAAPESAQPIRGRREVG